MGKNSGVSGAEEAPLEALKAPLKREILAPFWKKKNFGKYVWKS